MGIAESLEIKHFFADNERIDGKEAVVVLIRSSRDKVEDFISLVKRKKPKNSLVEEIKVEDYNGNYYRYLSAMQLSKIATYGGRMLDKQEETIRMESF